MPPTTPDRRPSRGPRGDRGQAAIDYLGVVAVVALILGVVGTITVGPSIVNGVGETFQRALCKVTGDSCVALERQACTVRSNSTDVSVTARIGFYRGTRGMNFLRTERSDGTVELTLLDKLSGGVELKSTPSGRLMLGGREVGFSGLAQGALIAELGGGQTWRVPDDATADKLQDEITEVMIGRGVSTAAGALRPLASLGQKIIGRGSGRDLPEPTAYVGSLKGDASLKLDKHFGTQIDLGGSTTVGGRRDVGGGGMVYLATSPKLTAAVLGGMGDLGLDGEVRLAMTIGKDGKPTSLVLSGAGNIKGDHLSKLPLGKDRPVLEKSDARGRVAQVSATLDLSAPESRAAVDRLLDALKAPDDGDVLGAARNVGRAFVDHTRLDIATYSSDQRAYGGNVDLVGGAAGAEYKRVKTNLLGAWTRPAGGAWEERTDCLQA